MRTTAWITLWLLCIVLQAVPAEGNEISGFIGMEGRFFAKEGRWSGQKQYSYSFVAQPQYYHQWENGSSLTFTPFVRKDSADDKRSHFDIRELNYLWLHDEYEVRVGFGRVFWGATEFVHLADIINQTDYVENVDEEEKLGQPMVQLTTVRDWGTVSGFIMPYFRERTYPGTTGRLRYPLPVHTGEARYQSDDGPRHVDMAIRYSHTIGGLDFGIYHFVGTSREPTLALRLTRWNLNPFIMPYYEQIKQTGMDAQWAIGSWLWKLEGFHRTGQGDAYTTAAGGFEYTFYDVAHSGTDMGLLLEYAWDERGNDATTLYQRDIMYGVRLVPNDTADSHLLVGILQDVEDSSQILAIEATRRIGDRWRINIEARGFFSPPDNFIRGTTRDDDYLGVELGYYF